MNLQTHAVAARKPAPTQEHFGEDPLRAIGIVSQAARHATIFNEGDFAQYSYKVMSGAVRLSKVMLDGRRQIADFALAGDLFGLDWSDDYTVTAEALTEVTLICYPRSSLARLGHEKAAVRDAIVTTLRRDLWAAQNHLVMLGCQTAHERVASFITQFMERCHAKGGQKFQLPMGRQDIADYLGLTIETVCRTLTDFKQKNLIVTPSRHEMIVRNIVALRAIAQGEGNE
ncbi:MAG TPA: helix-turn-helix domain-containing protein [Rhizomicrobium sp.]|nr:helix-turn-helix domain-containing protein [Rhizomicrobium sp.]